MSTISGPRSSKADSAPWDIIVYGAGGMGREVRWLADECGHRVRCYVDDAARPGQALGGLSVLTMGEAAKQFAEARVALAIGSPRNRERAADAARAAGFGLATLVHPSAIMSENVIVGAGTIICAGTIVTTDVVIADHVQINIHCTISHDVTLAAASTLAPGVHVAGTVHIGRRAQIGIGAVIINGSPTAPLVVGDDATVGAGACVTRSVPSGATVAGVPARELA